MDVENVVRENFVFDHPRDGQLELISEIVGAVNEGYKFVIVNAATGVGKSSVAATLARIYNSSYICTMTKQLQEQYLKDFDKYGFTLVKGRNNFVCQDNGLLCSDGTCKTLALSAARGWSCMFKRNGLCHYWNQKMEAVDSDVTFMNYAYFMPELNYLPHFNHRELLICDEAHNLEQVLFNWVSFKITKRRVKRDLTQLWEYEKRFKNDTQLNQHVDILFDNDEDEMHKWVAFLEILLEDYSVLVGLCEEFMFPEVDSKQLDSYKGMQTKIKNMIYALDKSHDWVVSLHDDNRGVEFKPIDVHEYGLDIFDHADVCVFLSATILDKRLFCKWLGLDVDDVYMVNISSPFDKSRRPFKLDLAGKMSFKYMNKSLAASLPVFEDILDKHEGEKGVVHTNSYTISSYLESNVDDPRLIFHDADNREEVLEYFMECGDDVVLVSPSMSEGVNLPYDLCRFQVIYKVPFPYLGDRQIKARMQRDKYWYNYATVMSLLQAYGRGMRAVDDYCVTYCLDSNIQMVLNSPMYRRLVPDFLREAIVK